MSNTNLVEVRTSKKGVDYLPPNEFEVLKNGKTVITKLFLSKITHNSADTLHFTLKIGRYIKPKNFFEDEELESLTPKSEITLNKEEFDNFIAYLQNNLAGFQEGCKNFIPVNKDNAENSIELIKKFFVADKTDILELIIKNNILPDDLIYSLKLKKMKLAIDEFENELEHDKDEDFWQKFFQKNRWILGTDFISILDKRRINEGNIADYLVKSYDGFLDLIELKRPDGKLKFWAESLDHNNYYQHSDLTKAITQISNYLSEIEKECNSLDFYKTHDCTSVIKPRATLVFGRSNDWCEKKCEAYRLLIHTLNTSLHILTFDHVLARAKRILEIEKQYEID